MKALQIILIHFRDQIDQLAFTVVKISNRPQIKYHND